MNRCLVTGCRGFIGSSIVTALLDNDLSVRGLTRQKHPGPKHPAIELFQGDLTKPATLTGVARGMDTIIHAAGFAHASTYASDIHRQTTLEGTRHLLAEAEKNGVRRFIFISSVKAMPDPGAECLDESATGLPKDEYGRSRRMAEDLVLEAVRPTGMHVCILRPALVYGPGCKGNLASLLRWIDRGLFPPIPDTGNIRSMVDVRDLARAALLAGERPAVNGRAIIVTDGEDYSTRRIYTAIRTAFGMSVPRWTVPVWALRVMGRIGDGYGALPGRPAPFNSSTCSRLLDSACYRSNCAGQLLGFRPQYCFEDALPAMTDLYRQAVSAKAPG
ncbi:MAG TPA: NAD-dependent epimerase/dehydratase family protein [Gammaproteobacteria bacterium]|nr:NAD-dependent epimerase/dehydratase family protein [Gammaproteobacteria bacterium]